VGALGLALILFGLSGLAAMELTGAIPKRGWSYPSNRIEDPEGFRRWQLAFIAVAVVGAVGTLVTLLS
jgi:hypothetical protein